MVILVAALGFAVALGAYPLLPDVEPQASQFRAALTALTSLIFGSIGLVFIRRAEATLIVTLRGRPALALGFFTLGSWWTVAAIALFRAFG